MRPSRLLLALAGLLLPALVLPLRQAAAQVRIKDIADVEGVRENQLIGYGLVVGLNNTGDKLNNAVFTREFAGRHAGAPGRQHPRPDQPSCRPRTSPR